MERKAFGDFGISPTDRKRCKPSTYLEDGYEPINDSLSISNFLDDSNYNIHQSNSTKFTNIDTNCDEPEQIKISNQTIVENSKWSFNHLDHGISQISSSIEDLRSQLCTASYAQSNIFRESEETNVEDQYTLLNSMLDNCKSLQWVIGTVKETQILSPSNIEMISSIEDELVSTKMQVNMYVEELNFLLNPDIEPMCACLVIERQPFPKSVHQNKPLKDPIVVKILTGISTETYAIGNMEASVEAGFITKSTNQYVSNNEAVVDDGTALFYVSYIYIFMCAYTNGTLEYIVSQRYSKTANLFEISAHS